MLNWNCIFVFIDDFERLLSSLDVNEHFIFKILDFGLVIFVESFLFEPLLPFFNQYIFILINSDNKLTSPLRNSRTHLAPLLLGKLKYFEKLTVIKIPYRRLNCISVLNSKTFKHRSSGSFFLLLDQIERTAMVSKGIRNFLDQFGKDSAFVIVGFGNVVDWSVEECVFFSWMAMEV